MATSNKRRSLWLLYCAVVILLMGILAFARARVAAARHTVIFMPDRFGGVGDTWMWPGQSYVVSVVCLVFGLYLLVVFLRGRS